MDAIVGKAYSLRFEFMVDGEYVVPDVASVFYSVYDNAGAVISGSSNVAVSTTTTTQFISIQLASAIQTVAGGKQFEQRTVIVDWLYGGKSRSDRQHYMVTPVLNHRVTPRDVISYLAIKDGEVFEDEVKISPAYFQVRNIIGATAFDTALSSGGVSQIQVNNAIRSAAAYALLATIELRAGQKFGGDGASFARFADIDFDALRARVQADILDEIAVIGNVSMVPPLFMKSSPPDIFTGET